MARTKKTEAETVAQTLPEPTPEQIALAKDLVGEKADAPEPKVGKVEARLSAVETYLRDNAKVLGWPEFKG